MDVYEIKVVTSLSISIPIEITGDASGAIRLFKISIDFYNILFMKKKWWNCMNLY